jgi:two-component system NtrC family sensor kinase
LSRLTKDELALDSLRENKGFFQPDEEVVVVEVEDTGKGISEENLKKVFEPFFTTKGPDRGTGLGLAVSKNIIDMHKGLLVITSKEKQGTKATVVLKIT